MTILSIASLLNGCGGAQRRDPFPAPPPSYPIIVYNSPTLPIEKIDTPSVLPSTCPIYYLSHRILVPLQFDQS